MPTCLEPGCPTLVKAGRCQTHDTTARQAKAQRLGHQRGTTAERGYGARWQARALAFRQKYLYCGMRPGGQPPVMSRCHEQGLLTVVVGTDEHGHPRGQVDHVRPHRGDQRLMWDELGNWQSLCRACGAAKSRAGL